MKITAITKFKNGELLRALRESKMSGVKFSRFAGISQQRFSNCLCLRAHPNDTTKAKIEYAFLQLGIWFDSEDAWPPDFVPLTKATSISETQDVDLSNIRATLGYEYHQMIENSRDVHQLEHETERTEILDSLSFGPRVVLAARLEGKTLSSIANRMGVTKARVGQLKDKALRDVARKKSMADKHERRLPLIKKRLAEAA